MVSVDILRDGYGVPHAPHPDRRRQLGAQTFTAKVIGITDGDTIKVLHNRETVRVRLNGIDCPESGQPFGTRAKQLTGDLAFGQEVIVKARDTDRYGRIVAEVVLPDGRVLNHEIVKAGLAWWYRKYAPGDEVLERLEREAKDAKRGLWRDAEPIAPWEWRKLAGSGRSEHRPIGRGTTRAFSRPHLKGCVCDSFPRRVGDSRICQQHHA